MTLLPHLLGVFGLRGAEVEIHFHEPVDVGAFASRKDLARYCEGRVTEGISRANGVWRRPAGVLSASPSGSADAERRWEPSAP